MSTLTVAITHPTASCSVNLITSNLTLSHEADSWATLRFTVFPTPEQWTLLADETNLSNPLVNNAWVQMTRGAQVISSAAVMDITRNYAEPRSITVTCGDRCAVTNGSMATVNSSLEGGVTAPIVALTAKTLYRVTTTSGYDVGNEWHYYPVFADHAAHTAADCWVSYNNSRSAVTHTGLTTSSTTLTVVDGSQLSAPCFISIESELIYCDNLYQSSAGVWTLKIGERGCCGTSNANHVASALSPLTVYQRRLKPICMDVSPLITRDPSATRVPASSFRVRASEGRIDFAEDPTSWTTLAIDYSVYDIDAATAPTLESLAQNMLMETVANFGPQLLITDIETTDLATTLIPHFKLDGLTHCMDALLMLKDEYWAQGITGSDRLMIFHRASDDKIVFLSAVQATTPDFTLAYASELISSSSRNTLASASLVTYRVSEPVPLLSPSRCWHPSIGQDPNTAPNSGSVTANFDAIMFQDVERADAYGWQAALSTASHNIYTERLFDGDENTGWGIRCLDAMWATSDPAIYVIFAWTPGAVAKVIDYARLVFDLRNWVMTKFTISLVGFDAYTPGTPPTLGNVIDLGVNYEIYDTDSPSNERTYVWRAASGFGAATDANSLSLAGRIGSMP